MKILFTGASSPTGMHMIKELVAAGHEVTGTIRKPVEQYEGLKKERLSTIKDMCELAVTPAFGDDSFIELLKGAKWDILCLHAADASDPRSPVFDWLGAVKNNTNNYPAVLDTLIESGCKNIITTGSLYENDEGVGTEPREAFSPYGLSKGLSWQVFRYFARVKGLKIGKFVIPIAFGLTEDPKLTTYLIKTWFKGDVPEVRTPLYGRDYIPFDLMAKAYAKFLDAFGAEKTEKVSPSFYTMTNGEFAKLFASKMEPRIGVPCPVNFADQTEFSEPMNRINTDKLDPKEMNWDEEAFWDDLAKFYMEHYK